MNDRDFADAFERCTLPSAFHHRDHVHMAWIYLRSIPTWRGARS